MYHIFEGREESPDCHRTVLLALSGEGFGIASFFHMNACIDLCVNVECSVGHTCH